MQYQNSHFRPEIPLGRWVFMCCREQFGRVGRKPDISGRSQQNCDQAESRQQNQLHRLELQESRVYDRAN
jgi:hypothetical protein